MARTGAFRKTDAGCKAYGVCSVALLVFMAGLLAGCSGSQGSSNTVASIVVSGSSTNTITGLGNTATFTATAYNSSGGAITGVAFTWASSATSVASISSSGVATAVAAGTTQISATASGITSSAVTLTVADPVVSIAITPSSASIAGLGNTTQFTATAFDNKNNALTGITFTWASSNTGVATIGSSGLATAVASGSTQITAAAGGVTSAALTLSVTDPVVSIVVTPASPSIQLGNTQQFSATAYDNKSNALAGIAFTWASSNTSAATVNSSGLATSAATGTTYITATAGGITSNSDLLTVTPTPTYATGVAWQGASALANASVALVDSNGNTSSATTSSSGAFSIATTGFTPPFLVRVTVSSGSYLYSVSADANVTTTMNVSAFTDLIVRGWYIAQASGSSDTTNTAFGNITAYPAPAPATVAVLANTITRMSSIWLAAAGLNTTTFNPITTAMSSAEESVLSEITVNRSSGQVTFSGTLSGSSTTQTSSLSFPTVTSAAQSHTHAFAVPAIEADAGSSSSTVALSIATTTTTSSATSANTSSTTVPSVAAATALSQIQTLLANLAATVNAKGSSLSYTDLEAYVDPGAENDGFTYSAYLDLMATLLRGATLPTNPQIVYVKSLNITKGLADVVTNLQGTYYAGSGYQVTELQFSNESGSWLIYGDQLPFQINMNLSNRLHLGASYATYGGSGGGTSGTGELAIGGTIWTTTSGAISSASVYTTNGIADADTNTTAWTSASPSTFTENSGTTTIQLAPTSTTTTNLSFSKWDNSWTDLSSPVAAGTIFTIPITASGSTTNYTWTNGGYSTENISISQPSGTTISASSLGSAQTVTWTLPATFALAGVALTAEAYTGIPLSGHYSQCVVIGSTTAASTGFPTSGTLTIPASCSGSSVVFVEIAVHVQGVNGELVEPTLNLLVQ